MIHTLKKQIKSADRLFFNEYLSRQTIKIRRGYMRRYIKSQKLSSLEVFYVQKRDNILADLFDLYGSDKGSNKISGHVFDWEPKSYSDLYLFLFERMRVEVKAVFECGIGTNNPLVPSSMGMRGKPGASLRAWRDFFPNAQIFGADIDRDVLFEEERINTAYMDQTDAKSIQQYFRGFDLEEVDIVIDDGLHTFDAAVTLFENTISRLTKSGIYVIEDIHPSQTKEFLNYFKLHDYLVYLFMFSRFDGLPVGNLMMIKKSESSSNTIISN